MHRDREKKKALVEEGRCIEMGVRYVSCTLVNPTASWQRLKRRPQETCCARLSRPPDCIPAIPARPSEPPSLAMPCSRSKKRPKARDSTTASNFTDGHPGQDITQGRVFGIAAALCHRQQLPRRGIRSACLFPSRQPPCVRLHDVLAPSQIPLPANTRGRRAHLLASDATALLFCLCAAA